MERNRQQVVNGYLPVGQFASGTAWGSIFTDGTNQSGTTKKLIGGYSTTGVSLGAAGGYVDYCRGFVSQTAIA